MQEWSEGAKIAIDVIVACIIISALTVCITLGKNIMRIMDVQQAAAADVQAYRVTAAYEGTDVYPQDVVNLVLTNHGYPAVRVKYKNGTTRTWNTTTASSAYTSAAIGAVIRNDVMYTCTLIRDDTKFNADGTINETGTGEVIRYEFVQK